MKKSRFIELDEKTLLEIGGGSWLSNKICWLCGVMFLNAAEMALDGAAGHEVMGSK